MMFKILCYIFLHFQIFNFLKIPENNDITNIRIHKVCQSMDIRNNLIALKKLQSCQTVEGYLKIVLTNFLSEEYENITFPNLIAISGYLLIYEVSGLRTLSHLFPNLTVIRGEILLFDYALIIYEVSQLQEIGLYSLRHILNGGVNIDRNPFLCFANTINWREIVQHTSSRVHVKQKSNNECPTCPSFSNQTPEYCSRINMSHKPDRFADFKYFCWNSQRCQKACPKHCGTRGCIGTECCHKSCLGGCTGLTENDCLNCQHFLLSSSQICVPSCPSGTYNFLNTRCITAAECFNLVPLPDSRRNVDKKPYIPFNGVCSNMCPSDYQEYLLPNNKHTCVPCQGPCRKQCNGGVINEIDDSEKYFGCTLITGSLEIRIRSGNNIFEKLQKNLGLIETIRGYLTIVRSFSLKSLTFLSKLQNISGQVLENGLYSLAVYDNQNIEELWTWKNRTLFLENGTVFFHFNPKLCLNKIHEFISLTNLQMAQITVLNVSPNTNGDKMFCNVFELNVKMKALASTYITMEWTPFETKDYRNLLGYKIYAIQTHDKNISILNSRDPCDNNEWKIHYVLSTNHNEENQSVKYTMTDLKPYTDYAFYVSTYSLSIEKQGAQSSLTYFRTRPDTPSKVRQLQITPNSNKMFLKWNEPLFPNGNVTYYVISITLQEDEDNLFYTRNYCVERSGQDTDDNGNDDDNDNDSKDEETFNQEHNKFKISDKHYDNDEEDHIFEIDFENVLHNSIFIKRRNFRNIRSILDDGDNNNIISSRMDDLSYIVHNRSFTVTNLRHYSNYLVKIKACRERVDKFDTKNNNCSRELIQIVQTTKNYNLDNVTFSKIIVEDLMQNVNIVHLFWLEPNETNGYIVAYQIEYKNLDITQMKPIIECIPRELYVKNNKTYDLKQLVAGSYQIRISVITTAGNGLFSKFEYFDINDVRNRSRIIILAMILLSAIICLMIFFYATLRIRLKTSLKKSELVSLINSQYSTVAYVADEWEISRDNIEIIRELGSGCFGVVYEGVLRTKSANDNIKCAIKTVQENATYLQKKELLNEASIMKQVDCHHVVSLLGIVSVGDPVLVVMELMANGDLKSYLIRKQSLNNVDQSDELNSNDRIYRMAIEIADGMSYLSSIRFIHRDLSARNCMVSADLCVKIGDFGLSRDIYEGEYYHKDTKSSLPVRWMAPESLLKGTYSYASDVWSYGIVLWEIVTCGNLPYTGFSNRDVIQEVINGLLLNKPEICPDYLYNLMLLTWNYNPLERPTFHEIVQMLQNFVTPDFCDISFSLNWVDP